VGQDGLKAMKAKIEGIATEWELPDSPFKILRMTTEHQRHEDGGMQRKDWINFERGPSVAVILYKKDTKEIILVQQFRAPTLKYHLEKDHYVLHNDGQLLETVAGMRKGDEPFMECAIREVKEETGYVVGVGALEKIADFYPSPGGSSERIHLYYAEVTDADRDPMSSQTTAGENREAESIRVQHVPAGRFLAQTIDSQETIDAKILIASLLLRVKKIAQSPAAEGKHRYQLIGKPDCYVVLRTGHMQNVKDVDAWVNSETEDMEMDRFTATSVSAFIRRNGALTDRHGRVIEDIVASDLRRETIGRQARIGDVYSTTSGSLKKSHKVQRIFHVAAVRRMVGEGSRAMIDDIEPVTLGVLRAINRRNGWFRSSCGSALLPMIGTSEGGLDPEEACQRILNGTITYFEETPSPALKEVHISAFHERDVLAAEKCLAALKLKLSKV
jgi:ADP-ribose pyrophosphatase